jgi:hypothetical protein
LYGLDAVVSETTVVDPLSLVPVSQQEILGVV